MPYSPKYTPPHCFFCNFAGWEICFFTPSQIKINGARVFVNKTMAPFSVVIDKNSKIETESVTERKERGIEWR